MALIDDLTKYEGYIESLTAISGDISGFKNDIATFKSSVENNIKIDYVGLDSDIIQSAIDDLNSAGSAIADSYIPALNQKVTEIKAAIAQEEEEARRRAEEEAAREAAERQAAEEAALAATVVANGKTTTTTPKPTPVPKPVRVSKSNSQRFIS